MSIGLIALLSFLALPFATAQTQAVADKPASEAPVKAEEIKSALSNPAGSIEAGFVQVRHFTELDFDMTVKGSMSLKPGKELIWRTNSPMKTICTMTPKGLTLWDGETKKTNSVSAKDHLWLKTFFELQDKLLGGDFEALENHFKLERKDATTLLLVPKDTVLSGMFKSIQIMFTYSLKDVRGIVFTETNGDTISIKFFNVHR